jgi:hypothetical protein
VPQDKIQCQDFVNKKLNLEDLNTRKFHFIAPSEVALTRLVSISLSLPLSGLYNGFSAKFAASQYLHNNDKVWRVFVYEQ